MLLCTQLAPARHVVQVGEKISTRRGCPLSRLNRRFRVEIPVSETTPPLREAAPGPAGAVADEQDARTKPAAAAAATTADRDLSRLYHATPIAVPLPLTTTKRHHHLCRPATAKHRHGADEDPGLSYSAVWFLLRRDGPSRPAYLLDQYAIAIRCTPGNTTGTSSNNLRSARRCDRCWKAVNPSSPFGSPGIGRQPITGAAATTAARIAVALDGDPGGVPADETVRSVIGDTGYEIDLGGRGRISASIVQQDQAATGGR